MNPYLILGAAEGSVSPGDLALVVIACALLALLLVVLRVASPKLLEKQGVLPVAQPGPSAPLSPITAGIPMPTSPETPAQDIPPHILAVIAAAVHVSVQQPHRIVKVSSHATTWAIEGRRDHFQSHQFR